MCNDVFVSSRPGSLVLGCENKRTNIYVPLCTYHSLCTSYATRCMIVVGMWCMYGLVTEGIKGEGTISRHVLEQNL